MTTITVTDLTSASPAGAGTFDVLMRAVKAHLDEEFKRGTLKGPEYATVYLGSVNLAMQTGMSFLLQQQKVGLEVSLLEKQLLLAQAQVDKAAIELAMLTASQGKVPLEIAQLTAQNLLITQQKTNLVSENLGILSKTALTDQQKLNAVIEGTVLVAQECKVRAEYNLTLSATTKSAREIDLLTQKTATEKAQILALGVDDNSIIGKQKLLYAAQSDGFKRDAEQKAAKLLADTWSVRRTTDEATVADATNMLNDVAVGRAITKLLAGVGA